ncbi:MAG: toll/interleukin-1 receptor domain-containing protein [Granulosicoccus sp.]|nr:toll/interleukin-1 receptor domain-containing protein [Granulosicoccus sp.]
MEVFVSHAWEDKQYIVDFLKLPEFIDVWIDKYEMTAGDFLAPKIRKSIDDCHVFLIVISQSSIAKDWILQELNWAKRVEAMRNRRIILPVLIDERIVFEKSQDVFRSLLEDRIYVEAVDRSDVGMARAANEISNTLFRWLSDWFDDIEPSGNGNVLFTKRLDARIKEFQKRLYALKAALNWPLATLVKDDALTYLDESKNEYNAFTRTFMQELTDWEDEVKWRFERHPYKQYIKLVEFIRDDIYHGSAYALNKIISAVNSYDQLKDGEPGSLELIERENQEALETLDSAVRTLTMMTADFLNLLKVD